MNREEILEMSRSDHRNGDERQKKLNDRGGKLGFAIGAGLCVLMGTLERGVFQRSSLAIWLIFFGMEFAQTLPITLDGRKKGDIAGTALLGAIFLALLGVYIWKIMTVTE